MKHDSSETDAGFSPGLPGRVGPAASRELAATAAPLPSPHGVALELMRMMQREDVTVTQIANVLRADPAMSGRLISAANVAALSGRRPVVAVADAVTALGLTVVRGLVLGFSLVSDYGRVYLFLAHATGRIG